MQALPKINSRYWIALVAASIFGTNTGDYISDYLHLGHVVGLPYLLAALAGIFLLEKISPWATAIFFWAAIIVIRTAATNVADATHDIGIYGIGAVIALFAAFVFAVRRYKAQSDISPGDPSTPRVDAFYWVVMALAGIVGTLAGDISSAGLGFGAYFISQLVGWTTASFSFDWMTKGHILATLIYGSGILAMLRRYSFAELAKPYQYWTLLALIRTAGTAMGDYISKTSLGLYGATLVDGAIFISLIFFFYVFQNGNQARNAVLVAAE
jgi:uncharacterized membrane-anchored protein